VDSRARNERFRDGNIFRHVFERAVETCIAAGLVGGEGLENWALKQLRKAEVISLNFAGKTRKGNE
jgi:hypothetical protein